MTALKISDCKIGDKVQCKDPGTGSNLLIIDKIYTIRNILDSFINLKEMPQYNFCPERFILCAQPEEESKPIVPKPLGRILDI